MKAFCIEGCDCEHFLYSQSPQEGNSSHSMPYGVLYLCSLNKDGRRCGESVSRRILVDGRDLTTLTITLERYTSESKDCIWIVLQPGIFFLHPSVIAVSMNSV